MNVISARTAGSPDPLISAFTNPEVISLPRRRPAEWLPAPIPRPRGGPSTLRLYRPARSHSLGEKLLLGILAFLAICAIAYGFSCAVDLVQHWAQFNTGIDRLIQ